MQLDNKLLKLLTKSIKPFFNLIPSRIPIPIMRGPLKGMKWMKGAGAGEFFGLSPVLNLAEPELMSFAVKLLTGNDICFDIGANIGLYSLLFAKYSKFVYSFEPLPRNVKYLHKIMELNGIKNVVIIPVAVYEKVTVLHFKEGFNCATGRLADDGHLPVFCVSLDRFIEFYEEKIKPSLIKIDVEGAELSVLKGAKKLLLGDLRPNILLSIHGADLRKKCLEFLKSVGYNTILPIDNKSVNKASEFAAIGE